MSESTLPQVDQCCRALIGILRELVFTLPNGVLPADEEAKLFAMCDEAEEMLGDLPPADPG